MAWHQLFIILWVASVYASLPLFKDQALPQVPLGDTPASPSFERPTKTVSANAALPTVNLGYTIHRAVDNPNPNLYKFQNIRYAAPPTGNLRFRAPQHPLAAPDGVIEDGRGRKECPQATINWVDNFPEEPCEDCECCQEVSDNGICIKPCDKDKPLGEASKRLLGGLIPSFNLTSPDYYSEDCLFVDVWAPKKAFDEKRRLPVLVWIYGGAYIFGGKSLYFPGGLMDRATRQNRGGMIFVAMNYRMGALGFAAGEDIDDRDINAGLLDQASALQWVEDNIWRFGGDGKQVTVAGLSAGGGSILHHLTAYGGQRRRNFQRAISFSGGWRPVTNRSTAESTFRSFMQDYNKVSTIEELRQVPEEQMMQANYDQIISAPPGSFLYNPTAWGDFAPHSPTKLFQDGYFAPDIDVILSSAFDEGGQFTTAFKKQNTTVKDFVNLAFADFAQDEKDWITKSYDSGKDDAGDIGKIIGDATFRCHVPLVSDSKNGDVWRQRWNTTKSNGHGGDLLYLFWQPLVRVQSIRSALILQDYVVTFVIDGKPSTAVRNPFGVQPVAYEKYKTDDKEQFFDSWYLNLPRVSREEPEAGDLCRVWQSFSST